MSDPALFEVGDWTPEPIGAGVALPPGANVEREFQRLAAYLDRIGCVRSSFISHRDCTAFTPSEFPVRDWCSRCRALARFQQQDSA